MSRNIRQTMTIPEQPPENACLFLDVDGTLIDIAATPDAVVVPPDLLRDLRRAETVCGGALALVSGRSIAELDRLFSPVALKASGVHGAEFRMSDRPDGRWSKAATLPDHAWDELSAVLDGFPGTLVENKAYSYAIHYRATPESGPRLRMALERFLADRASLDLQVLPGHCVYELKRPGVDKGAAIRAFMDLVPFAGRIPIFIGDDVTDAPGFMAVTALGGHAYSVLKAFPGVEGTFSGPAAVRQWLARIGDTEAQTA